MTKRYVLHVQGGVDPKLVGPYLTANTRDTRARNLGKLGNEDDSVFWLNVTEKGDVTVGSYSGGFMEGLKGFMGSEG